ncbi:hypothetical protein LCGC14_1663870 [marine sediment metagenome]|uniref:N-acylneuraminate cytidylyltransferase n=1 Tax=marine sediment metagenome TaxID=412755 RepID=A0A0F9KT92_9ZZZZ
MKQSIIAIVIARGGSIRLPRKNALPFCGQPLLAWSILQSKHSFNISHTFLSTDDDEIEAIGRIHGVEIIRRPDWPNPDKLSAGPVIEHAVLEIEKQHDFDSFIVLLPTSPIREPDNLDNMIKLFNKDRTKDVIPLYNPKEMVVYKRVQPNLCFMYLFDKNYRYLTIAGGCQITDKKRLLHNDVDSFDTEKETDVFLEENMEGGKLVNYYPFKWYQQFDIDDKDDFELCEILMERYILKGRGAGIYEEYAKSR